MTFDIVNLRDAPQFIPDIADRLWHAWSQYEGEPLSADVAALDEMVAATEFPFTLVAIADGAFAGTVSAVAADLDERPELSPWVASLWVEPVFRRSGVAKTLIEQAVETLLAQGHPQIYLYAIPALQPFYLGLGWTLLEERFGRLGVDIFVRYAPDGRPG